MANKSHSGSDEPRKLSYEQIKKITKDFDDELILGRGGFGVVYQGMLDKECVAVKVFHVQGFDNSKFQKEFENLRRLKHQNVVKLVGFCNESEIETTEFEGKQVGAQRMHTVLCLEYVHNGSLGKHIPDSESTGLNWRTRYKIIKGICEGLKYLHDELRIQHLDLKPDNILLDKNMLSKITDFGLSRLFGEENTTKTMSSVGTRGYWPPEYIDRRLISKEFDIFSLGVIAVKIIAGNKCYDRIDEMTTREFIDDVHGKWRKRLGDTFSPRYLEVYCKQVHKCIEIALNCMEWNPHDRPTIQGIISDLIETETTIGVLGPQIEQFREEEPILPMEHVLKRPSPERQRKEMATDISTGKNEESKVTVLSTLPKNLPLDFLKTITDQFSSARIVGTGAFGTTYTGIMPDGTVIAVKKLAENTPLSRDKAFSNEIQNIMALHHANIVQLVGYCHEGQKKVVVNNGRYIVADVVESLLCYEYLPRGSLDKYLFDESSIHIDWNTRFKIIKGVCDGLHFLHACNIIHMDLKPESVLLDVDMVAKISDFALSRLFGQEQTRMNTLNVVGSYGYMAPEYVYRGEISSETDIYSLGLIIAETVTRERNDRTDVCARSFIQNVREKWTCDHIVSAYSSVDGSSLQQIKVCIEIGLECVEIDRKKRPSIDNIISRLDGRSRY
ncbi:unnamed protein product [Triticum turgidum subsp. durum]|uniref:Protein kinase domain-containing protein n=1 Tax=Triticum turgidum subsp. durum TaxID=4567 RepID=A0A9R1B831_TRITD|nr:unnamed protein product [Triticum turgidum subsp. durum]